MDPLQLFLVILILLLVGFLSIMGFQVFLILKDLREEIKKIDKLLNLIESHGLTPIHSPIPHQVQPLPTPPKPIKPHLEHKEIRRFFKRG